MPANRQNNPNFFSGAGINEIDYDINGVPTGGMPTRTIGQTQATSPKSTERITSVSEIQYDQLGNPIGTYPVDVAVVKAKPPVKPGVGAGKTDKSNTSINNDDNPQPTGPTNQFALNQSQGSLNQFIATQPNQLDQYASYTYSISWFVLTPAQYNKAIETQQPNVAGWQLLMQSGGAPTKGRSAAFPVDYYMDDLEIDSRIPFGGTNMANSAVDIRFKVTEPNGITLIQSLFNAVVSVYKGAAQAQTNASSKGETPNYLQAQYCLLIEFYGYDSQGKLVMPARGSSSGYGQQAIIAKYYPFRLTDIKFSIVNRAIEYIITGKPIPYSYNSSTDRGTIPFPFTMTGQTVDQLLNGSPVATSTNNTESGTRVTTPKPKKPPPPPPVGIQPGLFMAPVLATGNINQAQADALNLLAAGQMGS